MVVSQEVKEDESWEGCLSEALRFREERTRKMVWGFVDGVEIVLCHGEEGWTERRFTYSSRMAAVARFMGWVDGSGEVHYVSRRNRTKM